MKQIKKFRKKLIILLFIILIIFLFAPIKFVVKLNDIDKGKEFYIMEFIAGDCTDSGWWIIGDQDNLSISPIYVHLNGKDPSNYLSTSICYEDNKYIIYGSLKKETRMSVMGIEYDYYTLNSKEWDILEEIHGGTHKRFITIGDIKYFNIIF